MLKQNVYSSGWIHSYTAPDQGGQLRSTLADKLGWLAARAMVGLAAWLEKRRVSAELMALDDRELADIGLSRTDIDRVAEGSFKDKRLAA
jgi:uncharacterized protein YjiS (DUF1127 family)